MKRAVLKIIGPRAKIWECRDQNECRVNAPVNANFSARVPKNLGGPRPPRGKNDGGEKSCTRGQRQLWSEA